MKTEIINLGRETKEVAILTYQYLGPERTGSLISLLVAPSLSLLETADINREPLNFLYTETINSQIENGVSLQSLLLLAGSVCLESQVPYAKWEKTTIN